MIIYWNRRHRHLSVSTIQRVYLSYLFHYCFYRFIIKLHSTNFSCRSLIFHTNAWASTRLYIGLNVLETLYFAIIEADNNESGSTMAWRLVAGMGHTWCYHVLIGILDCNVPKGIASGRRSACHSEGKNTPGIVNSSAKRRGSFAERSVDFLSISLFLNLMWIHTFQICSWPSNVCYITRHSCWITSHRCFTSSAISPTGHSHRNILRHNFGNRLQYPGYFVVTWNVLNVVFMIDPLFIAVWWPERWRWLSPPLASSHPDSSYRNSNQAHD